MNLFIVVWLLGMSTPTRPEVRARLCPDSTTLFEFQVLEGDGHPAQWIADTALAVHPTVAIANPANLVQFVVDTAGVPVAGTFRVLKVTDPAVVTLAQRSVAQWRFRPAVREGCSVRQLVQTPIGR